MKKKLLIPKKSSNFSSSKGKLVLFYSSLTLYRLTPILIMKDKGDKPTEKKTIQALFKYIFDQQISILLMIDFKINPVSLKHFIDHYGLILPQPEERVSETETSQVSSIFEDKKCIMTEAFNKSIKGIRKREQTALIKEVNDEIKEGINSISNLSPLLPDFGCCHFSEISIASLGVTVNFSFKCLAGKFLTIIHSEIILITLKNLRN